MSNKTAGWVVGLGCIGMMFTLCAVQLGSLNTWDEALAPKFIASQLGNLGMVIGAFVGGKIIPPKSEDNG